MKRVILIMLAVIVLAPLLWLMIIKLEGQEPAVQVDIPARGVVGAQAIPLKAADAQSGLRRLWVGLYKDGKETVLINQSYPSRGLMAGGKVRQTTVDIKLDPKTMNLSDGDALLRVVARDYAWRGWFSGNKYYQEFNLRIDTQPPRIEVLSSSHNISRGGSGLVVYKLSEICPQSGVKVGEHFYPGYSGYAADEGIHLAFFALDYRQGRGTPLTLMATDQAGNSSSAGFLHYIKKNKPFKHDTINISDGFLQRKTPEFDNQIAMAPSSSLTEKFLEINRNLRQANYATITMATDNPERSLLWEGSFIRLPNAARKAGFADQREYRYKGRTIDHQVHLGIDLASNAKATVPAANSGRVVLAQNIGIYGNSVIIDHGFGLYSMYSHLSQVNVEKDQRVAKGDLIGRTGTTGLAGGDHLHFSMLVHNTFVNPVEWWDLNWIKNNIKVKLDEVAASNTKP